LLNLLDSDHEYDLKSQERNFHQGILYILFYTFQMRYPIILHNLQKLFKDEAVMEIEIQYPSETNSFA